MRRRISAGATLAVVVVFGGCDSGRPETVAPTPSVSSEATTATTTTTSSTTSTTTTTSSTTSTTSTTTSTTIACGALDIVVLGNSTDYWPNYVVGADAPTDDAWPAMLESRLRADSIATRVHVENASVLGAGFDIGLYGVTSMSDQLDLVAESHGGGRSVLFLSPSVVDLQLRSLDVDASYEAFLRLYADATSAFATVRVLPMNPVAAGSDVEIARAIAEFNRRLVRSGVIGADDRSPLLSDDGLFGRPEYYDDFDDGRRDTPGPDPDGLHPDADGHAAIATDTSSRVAELIPSACS